MKPSRTGTVGALLLLVVLLFAAVRPLGPLPPLGRFLDPLYGIVGSVRTADFARESSGSVPGLNAAVEVVYDDRGVPHIFAGSIPDAYRALGYVTARDRLFQIELQARAGGGTLTELVGEAALREDRATHASGMPHAAAMRLAASDTASVYWQLIEAYADGVNSYIDGMSPRELPFEYKLLGRQPKRWQPIDLMHLLNRMGQTLAVTRDELTNLEASAIVGREAASALFPVHAPIVEPIQPNGDPGPRIDAITIPPPGIPDSQAVALLHPLRADELIANRLAQRGRNDDAVGSNNWAVSPRRTADGFALLAGDPHLELTLPSIWYEVHLVVQDSLDVYGVTIPGAPGVVIGFNRAVSWTFTNTGADVMDYYVEQVNDSIVPTEYRLDGEWTSLDLVVQQYRDPSGRVLATDTLRFTHRGPMRRAGARWISTRWTVLETTRDFDGFHNASRASSAREWLDAMAESYGAPAQNMFVADTHGTIAFRSTGRFPLRPGDGRGNWLRDGSSSASDWQGAWPVADYPQSFDPAQGFLASANQEPLDPRVQPRYLGADWERPWRAMRINSLLRNDSAVTPDAMRRYQSDPGSARADWFVPAFIAAARAVPARQQLLRAVTLLGEWDRRYDPDNSRTVLFEAAMSQLSQRLWDEFIVDTTRRSLAPSDMMTAVLLRDSSSVWWDDKRTPERETRDVLLAQALETALDSLVARHGAPDGEAWQWRNHRTANIGHLLGLPAFSRNGVRVQGGPATLWPSTGNGRWGPSWRMVVEMRDTVRAWATYPGGQSGNPLSARYDDRVDQWSRGELSELRIPRAATDLADSVRMSRLVLSPQR